MNLPEIGASPKVHSPPPHTPKKCHFLVCKGREAWIFVGVFSHTAALSGTFFPDARTPPTPFPAVFLFAIIKTNNKAEWGVGGGVSPVYY